MAAGLEKSQLMYMYREECSIIFIFCDCASFRNTFHEALSFMMDGRYQLACLLHQATQT